MGDEASDRSGSGASAPSARTVVFLSKGTPGDDEFALWLGPRLEEAGYEVFADILTLEPGERWRLSITATLQDRAIKMLLCCRDSTLAKEGVQEEIGIASDLVKTLKDPKFIIPLRLAPYRKLFGIGELQYIDFARGWADGLAKLLAALKRQKVSRDETAVRINPNWDLYKRRGAILLKNEPERLTSNWLRVASAPDIVRYFEPVGAVDRFALANACHASRFPATLVHRGFLSFGSVDEINEGFAIVGRFEAKHEVGLISFIQEGLGACGLAPQDASNVVVSMFRQAWDSYCRARGFREYAYSKAVGFHASAAQARVGERIPWGRQGDRRSSMLRNVAKGHVWEYGVSSLPAFWPFPHFKLKSRVLFSPPLTEEAGEPYDDGKKQHRLRRTICKGWRNKQWHGRLMAFMEVLSRDSSFIALALGETAFVHLEAAPILFSSPVSTDLPNRMGYEDEEADSSTLGRPEPADVT
ncbi:TIR domain-containing protein [Rhizobiales bacterium GAS191]|nr:TIR domain-containing protein [Rhizobiales bacterium GAS191]